MSELNKKSFVKILILLFIYTVIALAVTGYLIYKKNNEILDEQIANNLITEDLKEDDERVDYSKILRISLTDKYYLNSIEIEEKEEHFGEVIDYDEYYNEDIYKVRIEYFQIFGLKDENIQNKINSDIENEVNKLVNKQEINNEEIDRINITATVAANFSDVISISIYKSTFLANNEIDNKFIGINFRLDTGEKINFGDLFTEDASIKNIIAQSAYNNLSFEYGINSETLDGDMLEVDYSKIENDVYKIVYNYNKNPKIDFYFNHESIYAYINNKIVTIDMNDFYEYINIYNLVDSKRSLYTEGNKEKINYVFGYPLFEAYKYFEKISNNTFLGIYNMYALYSGFDTDFYNEKYENTNKLIDKYKGKIIDTIKEKEKNNKKAQIYNITNIYIAEDGNLVAEGQKCEVSKKDFDAKIDEVFAETSKNVFGEAITYFSNVNNDEYEIYNIEILENEEELDVIQTDIINWYDL